jgi:hypothetical protein
MSALVRHDQLGIEHHFGQQRESFRHLRESMSK